MQSHDSTIVTDLGFGDAGKGSIVDFLARKKNVSAIVRYNGGGQAAHNVVTPDGKHHTFKQFGSGTFVSNVRTHLSRYMLVDPVTLFHEGLVLQGLGCGNPFQRLSIDEEALVVTPFHKAANRLRERLRGDERHGSCGMGIGETMSDSLEFSGAVRVKDLLHPALFEKKLADIQERKREIAHTFVRFHGSDEGSQEDIETLNNANFPTSFARETFEFIRTLSVVQGNYLKKLAANGSLLFEGAQGVLLDQWHGFHPYTTWSKTTSANAEELLQEIGYDDEVKKLGVLRAYHTRHGPGPFPTEDEGLSLGLPDMHNTTGVWQGDFRVGWFDAVLARYAVSVCGGVDSLAITNIDRLSVVRERKIAVAYNTQKEGAQGGEQVINLKVKPVLTDLAYQEEMTQLLMRVTPVYATSSLGDREYLQEIARHVGVPVSLVSYGPTAEHKEYLSEEGHLVNAA